ncbi:MAG TPA: SDR family oxidoreductase [Terriglobales bacterium]|nr:SDR family oxidoreductase [Terriglobales bacterium]
MPNSQPVSNVLEQFRLDGRVAFITGAAGHLGRPMAEALASAGAHVVLNGRRCEPLDVLAAEITSRGQSASVACFDITQHESVQNCVAEIEKKYKRLDILVNNASVGRAATLETASIADFDDLYRVSVTAAFDLIQSFLPLLKAAARENLGGASVINISSMYGVVSPDPAIYGTSGANNPPYYGAAKAGLIQLTRYAACHLAPEKIRVNCISPGPFPADHYLQRDPAFHDQLKRKNPMHRTGQPAELQGPLLFLASDASSYVTGINMAVDGGWTAW